jgi:hypothetical protein
MGIKSSGQGETLEFIPVSRIVGEARVGAPMYYLSCAMEKPKTQGKTRAYE